MTQGSSGGSWFSGKVRSSRHHHGAAANASPQRPGSSESGAGADPRGSTVNRTHSASGGGKARGSASHNAADVKQLCRLIATHQRKPCAGSVLNLYVDGESSKFRVVESVTIGQNVCCLVFERVDTTPTAPSNVATRPREIVFAFNWFSPSGLWDYITLGTKLVMNPGSIDSLFSMCDATSMDQAQRFAELNEISALLTELQHGGGNIGSSLTPQGPSTPESPGSEGAGAAGVDDATPSQASAASNKVDLVTVTGFSMGGTIAHAFSVLLKESWRLPQALRCVGFGCPRPGNAALTAWCSSNLTPDSMNVLLACTEDLFRSSIRKEACPPGDDYSDPAVSRQCIPDSLLPADGSVKADDVAPHIQRAAAAAVTARDRAPCAQGNCFQPSDTPSLDGCSKWNPNSVNDEDDGDDDAPNNNNKNQPCRKPYMLACFAEPLVFDPVSRSPSSRRGFDLHPNAHVVVQQRRAPLRPLGRAEKDRLLLLDLQESTEGRALSSLYSFATTGSVFSADTTLQLDQLHSVLKYYEALCGCSEV